MSSIDLKRTYREHYSARPDPQVVDVPSRPFLMVDGHGDPNTSAEYRQAVETIYPLAYALRAAIKAETGDAYTVMPLEGLWWVADMADFDSSDKSNWDWTAMICLPDAVEAIDAADVMADSAEQKQLVAGPRARIEYYAEGLAAQILHIGPYADEAPNIMRLHDFIAEQGAVLAGKHHEIYLSDARRADPAKLRTIIRQPFADA